MSAQELLLDANEFFAPVSTDLISSLIARYNQKRKLIDDFLEMYSSTEVGNTISYFCQRHGATAPTFVLQEALSALNSEYWSEALALTDVYNAMPQKRRDEWYKQMNSWREAHYRHGKNPAEDLPDFTEETVRETIGQLLADRSKFFAEKVDGVFKQLSCEHVTNCPQGFSKRMIVGYIHNGWMDNYSQAGYVRDLRAIVAKFMGRDEPDHNSTSRIIKHGMENWGEWVFIDGGALKIRIYKKGTAHFEVHPDMAWRLNAVLASLYPMAIPESFRRKPVKMRATKEWPLIHRPLPIAVLEQLRCLDKVYDRSTDSRNPPLISNALSFQGYSQDSKQAREEACQVLSSIGGVLVKHEKSFCDYWKFEYEPKSVISEILCSGCIPDKKSHQYYPTPKKLAQLVVDIAAKDSKPDMHWLEPSAGTGNIADLFPVDANVACYEISELHCAVLKAKGYDRAGKKTAKCLDFLNLAADYRGGGYDRICLNPPFSDGRWRAHVEAAAKCLKKDGRLVAILPSGAKNTDILPGYNCTWSRIFEKEFIDASVNVVILTAEKINQGK